MTSTTSNAIGKVAALAAGFALVAMSFAVAPAAHAQTTTTTTTTTSMTAPMFTTDLTVGSTGASVSALQTWLISKGYSIPAGATGYFGTQTKAAVAAFQTANGISPAAGYFGPITRAKVNAMGGSTTGGTTTVAGCAPGAAYSSTTGQPCSTSTSGGSTTLSGGEGTINNFQTVGASNVTLGAGATQQVYGFQFVAGGSDLSVNRIYFDVYNTLTSTGSTRPWVVFQTATLKDGSGNVVATVDATNQANWSQDGTAANGNQVYRLSYENVNNVVKMGATQTYYLTLSTQGAFATGTYGGVYSVALAPQGMRATDALGLQQYSTSNAGTGSFVSVTNNATGSVVLSTGSNNPQTQTIMANQSAATQNVTVNTFTLQNNGTAGLTLYTLPVTLHTASTSAGSDNLNESSMLVQDVKLWSGTTLLDTESPSTLFLTGGTLNFKNLNFALPVGATQSFSITADIQPIGGSNAAPSGAALVLTVPGTTADIETTSGAIVAPTSASTGNVLAFATQGLTVDATPASANWIITTSGNGTQQTGTYNFTFNVTAFGQDIYVSSTTSGFLPLTVYDGNGAATTTVAETIASTADRSAGLNYVIHSGQTKSFTIGYTKQGQNGVVQAKLSTLKYGTVDTTSGVIANSYTLPSAYQSSQQFLAD